MYKTMPRLFIRLRIWWPTSKRHLHLIRGWLETEVYTEYDITRRDVIKKTTKTLFFKHLYLICRLFITLCLTVMYYISLTFHTLVFDQPEEIKKENQALSQLFFFSYSSTTVNSWKEYRTSSSFCSSIYSSKASPTAFLSGFTSFPIIPETYAAASSMVVKYSESSS